MYVKQDHGSLLLMGFGLGVGLFLLICASANQSAGLYVLACACVAVPAGVYITKRIMDYLKHKPKSGRVVKQQIIKAHWFFWTVPLELASDMDLSIWVPTRYRLKLETYVDETSRWYRGWVSVSKAEYDSYPPGALYWSKDPVHPSGTA